MKIWAHRGCCYNYPENTLAAFEAACHYDITGIELDIQLSKDGEIMVFHDEKLERSTEGTGLLKDYTMAELQSLKIKSDESGQKIPTMKEVLDLMKPYCINHGILINIELKNSEIRYEGMEEKILAMVKEYGLEDYIVYSSFLPRSIKMIKELKPDAVTGALGGKQSDCLKIAQEVNADALHPYVKMLDLEGYSDKPVRAFNIMTYEPFFPSKDPYEIADFDTLAKYGVTDIFTNVSEYYTKKVR